MVRFFSDIKKNERNISESHVKFLMRIFDYKYFEKHSGMLVEEKVRLIEEIFNKNNVKAKKLDGFESSYRFYKFEFIYPLDTEVVWFLV